MYAVFEFAEKSAADEVGVVKISEGTATKASKARLLCVSSYGNTSYFYNY